MEEKSIPRLFTRIYLNFRELQVGAAPLNHHQMPVFLSMRPQTCKQFIKFESFSSQFPIPGAVWLEKNGIISS